MKLMIRNVVETLKIKDLFSRLEILDRENETKSVEFPLYVSTPYGYNKIVTAFRTEKQKTVTTYFGNNKTLKTSGKHKLKSNGQWKTVDELNVGDTVETKTGTTKINEKNYGNEEILYDISVDKVHCYYSNEILSHNSWVLAKIGTEAMKHGKNVLHFTLE